MPGWLGRYLWPWRRENGTVRLRVRGVVGWPGPCATRRETSRWAVQLTLSSWGVVGGWPQGGGLRIVGETDDAALAMLQHRYPEGAVVEADVLLPLTTDAPATLLAVVEPRAFDTKKP